MSSTEHPWPDDAADGDGGTPDPVTADPDEDGDDLEVDDSEDTPDEDGDDDG